MMNRIIFCDFDGTITAEETFVGMLRQFATQSYDDIKNRILNRQINLCDGVRRLVESIPSERYSIDWSVVIFNMLNIKGIYGR